MNKAPPLPIHPKLPPRPSNSRPPYSTCVLLLALLASKAALSSRSVTQTQNQLNVSTKAKAKKTRFLRASPPQVEGA